VAPTRFQLIALGPAVAVTVAATSALSGGPAQPPEPSQVMLPVLLRGARVANLAWPPTAPPATGSPATATATPRPTESPTSQPSPSPTPTTPEWCGAIETIETGRRPTMELHVAPAGSDSAGDGSLDRPFATIARAARAARPGTAILVHSGTYPGGQYVEDLRGTADAPIWLGGATEPGALNPVLLGGGEGLHLTRVAYLVVHDLDVRGATANGINIDDGGDYANAAATHHLLLRDIGIEDIGSGGNQDCLKLSGVNHFQVLWSGFSACGGGGSAIDMVGVHHGLIAKAAFVDLGANAIQAKGGSSDVEIRWNGLVNAGDRAVNMGGSTGFAYFRPPLSADMPNAEARDIRVLANTIVGSQAPVAFVGCVDCLVANNTIVDPDRWVLRILQETTSGGGFTFEPARNGRFVNNLVYFSRGRLSTTVNVGPNTAPATFSFAHNLWYAHDDPARSRPDLPVAETGAVIGRDPLLGEAWRIPADSPAVGAGLTLPGLRGDSRGACYRDPPSIGAFEAP
jgi:hypothetical protein